MSYGFAVTTPRCQWVVRSTQRIGSKTEGVGHREHKLNDKQFVALANPLAGNSKPLRVRILVMVNMGD